MQRVVLALVLTSGLLVGCGFHLRGSSIEADIASAYVSAGANVTITGDLTRQLEQAGVKILDSAEGAAVEIDLLEQQGSDRTLSYTNRATTAESEVGLGVRYRITGAHGKVLLDDRWARATRTYLVDTNNLVGSNQQRQLLSGELAGDVAQQIIRGLNAATRAKPH